jgi:hypothetical protein
MSYVSKPRSKVHQALNYMAGNCGRATSEELSRVMQIAVRQVPSYMKHAQLRGVVRTEQHFRPARTQFESGLVAYSVFVLGGQDEQPASGADDGVSVRRPKVARDVWQFAQGAPL